MDDDMFNKLCKSIEQATAHAKGEEDFQEDQSEAELKDQKTYTPKAAFQKIDNGVWMTTGGYTWRNRKTERGKHGQYLAFGEYPYCVRSTSAFTLENVLNVGEDREWRRAEVIDELGECRFDPAGA